MINFEMQTKITKDELKNKVDGEFLKNAGRGNVAVCFKDDGYVLVGPTEAVDECRKYLCSEPTPEPEPEGDK